MLEARLLTVCRPIATISHHISITLTVPVLAERSATIYFIVSKFVDSGAIYMPHNNIGLSVAVAGSLYDRGGSRGE
jgi:hypothetical protein